MRVAVYIDGGFLRRMANGAEQPCDADFVERFAHGCVAPGESLARAFYYDDEPRELGITWPVSGRERKEPPQAGWLGRLARRPAFDVRLGRREFKGFVPRWVLASDAAPSDEDFKPVFDDREIEVQMAVDIVRDAVRGHYGRAVAFTGGAGIAPALRQARREGVEVVVVGLPKARPDDRLLRDCDLVREVAWPPPEGADRPAPTDRPGAPAEPRVVSADLPLAGGGGAAAPRRHAPPSAGRLPPPAFRPAADVGSAYPEGERVRGRVVRYMAEIGAIVELDGGHDGAISPTEIDWKREAVNPSFFFKKGEEVDAVVIGADPTRGLVRLSTKRLEPDPWERIDELHSPGQSVRGRTSRPAKGGGTVVELDDGFEAVLPPEKLGWTHDRVRSGEDIEALVTAVDREARRIELSLIRRDGREAAGAGWGRPAHGRQEPGAYRPPADGHAGGGFAHAEPHRDDPARQEALARIEAGQVLRGTVTKIAEYGAFVGLEAGLYGLVHKKNLSWRHVHDVFEVVDVDDEVEVKVLDVDHGSGRIALGMKQLEEDPWEGAAGKYARGQRVTGKVASLVDYGAFVELDEGVSGLLHMSDMAWRRVPTPADAVSVGQEVEVVILEIDPQSRRMSLGMKQLGKDPWEGAAGRYSPGQRVTGAVTRTVDYGAFVQLEEGIDGLVHASKMGAARLAPGQEAEVEILSIDAEHRRIELGLAGDPPAAAGRPPPGDDRGEEPPAPADGPPEEAHDPWDGIERRLPVGSTAAGTVTNTTEFGAFVRLEEGVDGLVHASKMEGAPPVRGQEVEVDILRVDRENRRIELGLRKEPSAETAKFFESHPEGSVVAGTVREVTMDGLRVELPEGAEGMVRPEDLSDKVSGEEAVGSYTAGMGVSALVLGEDKDGGRIRLGVRQLSVDAYGRYAEEHPLGDLVTGKVAAIAGDHAEVRLADKVTGILPVEEASEGGQDSLDDVVQVGDEMEFKLIDVDLRKNVLILSLAQAFADEPGDDEEEDGH